MDKAFFGMILLMVAPIVPLYMKLVKLKQFSTAIRLNTQWGFPVGRTIVLALGLFIGLIIYLVFVTKPTDENVITAMLIIALIIWHRIQETSPSAADITMIRKPTTPDVRKALVAEKAPNGDEKQDDDDDLGKGKSEKKDASKGKKKKNEVTAVDLQKCIPEPVPEEVPPTTKGFAALQWNLLKSLKQFSPPPEPIVKEISAERAAAFFNTGDCTLHADRLSHLPGITYLRSEDIIEDLHRYKKAHDEKGNVTSNDIQMLVKRLVFFSSHGDEEASQVTPNGIVHVLYDPANHQSWVRARRMMKLLCKQEGLTSDHFPCYMEEQ